MNIYDIAKLSGVSTASVSRVMNNGNVSEKTKAKVLKVIEETTFSPNVYARGLNINSMKVIGVIVSDISDMYYSKAVSIIEKELKKNCYDIILYCTGNEIGNASKYLNLLMSKKTDGVIFVGSKFKVIEKKLSKDSLVSKIPIIMINTETSSKNIYSIMSDDKSAICDTLNYLFDKGHKNFLYLYDTETASGINKLEGFKKGLLDCNIPIEDSTIIKCQRNIEKAKRVVIETYHANKNISAIITSEDELAVGALKAANELGLNVPNKLAITGYNNSILSLSCTPELTSVDNKVSTLCEIAVKVLMDVLNNKSVANKININCELIKRKTT
jgi:LacI family transcriptional regulator